jgi:putative DNA methylase
MIEFTPKKLIEVALPLEAINAESAREKSIRHGHPSTLHLWWARRPLAAARAVIFSSLVDDPSSHPEQFPTEEAQAAERQRLFTLIEKLVKWENSNNQEILAEAKAEILKSTGGKPPALLDPFAGGGSIPLEAQRLGLEAHASDLNPVAVMINKAMIEIPPKFAGKPPVNPGARKRMEHDRDNPGVRYDWSGAKGLAEDVRYYGEWMKKEAFKRIGHLYPKVAIPKDLQKQYGGEYATVIAWIWARTVKCPNPACGCEMPLSGSFVLSTKKGKEAYIEPIVEGNNVQYKVRSGKNAPKGTVNRTGAKCICCGEPVEFSYVREEGKQGRMDSKLIAIVAEGNNERLYYSPNDDHEQIARCNELENVPDGNLPDQALGFRIQAYGMKEFKDLFTVRQQTALTILCELVKEAQKQIVADGGTDDYAKAVSIYLAFAVDREADIDSAHCSWINTLGAIAHTFGRQAISMSWDYAEANIFSNSSGCFSNMLNWVQKCIENFPLNVKDGSAVQHNAQTDNGLRNIMVSTDPPYYDNIGYADLSDYFYMWMRLSLRETYPDLFKTMLVPKAEELIATPFRFEGSMDAARSFFEDGMLKTFEQVNEYVREDIPTTVYYAYKQSEDDADDKTASTGWETMLSAIINSGFSITGTWPMRTERQIRLRSIDSNALASSIVLVCRKRPPSAPTCTRRDFVSALKRELKPALAELQRANIAPVDLAQSAIGPGMAVYSRFSRVLEADGSPMSVRAALHIINQELDLYFTEQDGVLDADSRFCVDLYTQYAFNDIKFGEADVLARAKNTSVDRLAGHGVLYAQKGVVHLTERGSLPAVSDKQTFDNCLWLLTQQLTQAMESGGVVACAEIAVKFSAEAERGKDLAYRLFTIAERKNWAGEAYAYNSLVIAWPEIQAKVADLRQARTQVRQGTLL